MLIGVNDAGQISGVALGNETVQAWINQCKLSTLPSIIPDVDLIDAEGKVVAVIGIDEYPIKPVAYRGRYYKRIHNANHPMTPTEISDAHIKLINVTLFNLERVAPDRIVTGGVTGGVNTLYRYIDQHPDSRTVDLVKTLQLPRRSVERWLQQLKTAGKIEFRGAPKTGGYHAIKKTSEASDA